MLEMSLEELAKAAGCTEKTLRNFESNRTAPRASTLRRIQAVLEERGIEFTNGDGIGVRLRTSPTRDPKHVAP
jgi:transcriptional regulator with XRE-family HTH domain